MLKFDVFLNREFQGAVFARDSREAGKLARLRFGAFRFDCIGESRI